MRIAHIADNHFDAHSRLEECIRVHDWIAEDVAKRGVDLVTLGGDLFERGSTVDDRNPAAEWLLKVAESAPVIGVQGNHEKDRELEILNRLRSKHRIRFHSTPFVDSVEDDDGIECLIACLPWPRRSSLLANVGTVSRESANQVAADHLRNVLRGLGAEMWASPAPARVFLGHVQMSGAKVGAGQPPLVGCDFELSAADLSLVGAHAYLLGHIHFGQEVEGVGAPAFYPGSPYRTTWGETEEKRYAIVDVEPGGKVAVEYVATPARQMVLFEASWGEAAPGFIFTSKAFPHDHRLRDCEIRFRWLVPNEHREAARALAAGLRSDWLAAGAHSVKLEECVQVSTRARVPEIATAKTTAEKLELYWDARGALPDTATHVRLLGRLRELEEAAS